MKFFRKNKGITLVALVITIVILLILAGVTITMITGENGLFGQAQKAVKSYDTASEMEILSLSVVNYNITNNEEDKLGEKLSKRDVSNPDWHIIKDEENIYADGWYFIEQGHDLPNGSKAKNNWIVNYETGEIIQLEEKKYNSITIEDTMAVKEDLIINLDSAMVDDNVQNNKESIEKTLGTGVKLHNFDFSDDGLINNEFVFDGENDFITINYQESKKNFNNEEKWFENGFTFEFYGTMQQGKMWAYDEKNWGKDLAKDGSINSNQSGIFQVTEKNDDKTNEMTRVLAFGNEWNVDSKGTNRFFLGLKHLKNNLYDEFSISQESHWWKVYDITKTDENAHYYTISIMKINDDFTQSYYEDGKLVKKGNFNKNCITQIKQMEKNLITVGAIETGYLGSDKDIKCMARTSKIKTKALRLYNRGLTDTEIQANYEKTMAYHSLMESSH